MYVLQPNYPNPFSAGSAFGGNPETTIRFQLPVSSDIEISIHNSLGQKIRTIVKGHQNTGYHQVSWDGLDDEGEQVPSGVYLYRIKAGPFVQTRKMLLLQ